METNMSMYPTHQEALEYLFDQLREIVAHPDFRTIYEEVEQGVEESNLFEMSWSFKEVD
jgi:hypothetical protein